MTEKKKIRIGVYGTLKRGHGNWKHFLNNDKAKYIETITVPFQLVVSGLPFMQKKPGEAELEIFEIEYELLKPIDGLEGHPSWYRREPLSDVLPEDNNLKDKYGDVQVYFYDLPEHRLEGTKTVYSY